ncbi:DNA polymerase III subunit gamma/tau [Luteimonas pelagia]
MSYLVLARKWRPKRFAELVGQEHVVRALTNALDSGRVHHAFLFTGTRGVGKTTIARIFAKSLNCERGTSSDPCGECETCLAIDAGRYIDLLEIDAASNTGVDNVRELIENAQYMPSRGRYKVYLVDEVHMLSKAAFNALLKTLEEPPEHVKFLFATTDPEKLLVTVLSRCLQFNLKRLDEGQIEGQVRKILSAEGIDADDAAVAHIARAADGSLRDGLSLLDQAIAYTGANADGVRLPADAVEAMLGTVDRTRVGALLDALADGDGDALLGEVEVLAGFSPDWTAVLDAMAAALHRIQVRQLVPGAGDEGDGRIDVAGLAARVHPELVQLWYQMALAARRDLAFAPSPRTGFEMGVLRMLAFRPGADDEPAGGARGAAPKGTPAPRRPAGDAAAAARAALQASPPAGANAGPPSPARPPAGQVVAARVESTAGDAARAAPSLEAPPVAAQDRQADARPVDTMREAPQRTATLANADAWLEAVEAAGLGGPVRELAAHAVFVGHEDGVLRLSLQPGDDHLQAPSLVEQLARALAPRLGAAPCIRFESAPATGETLHQRQSRERDARQAQAEVAFERDPGVRALVGRHGARIVPESIRPLDATG